MRKIYSFIASAAMMFVSLSASAQMTMTEENSALDEMGYRLEKDVNFVETTVNGKSFLMSNYSGSGNCFVQGEEEDYKINGQGLNKVANPVINFMSIQLWGNYNVECLPGTGLRSTRNERWIVVNNLREGQILAIDISNTDPASFVANSTACNGNTGWADTMAEPLQVEEISQEVHDIQELAEEGSADKFRYFKVLTSGPMYAKFNGKSPSNTIYRMQIWSDKNDVEVVSVPTYKLSSVQYDSRRIEFFGGESTFGADCRSYYITERDIEEGIKYPIWMKETEEIDHYENPDLDPETNEPIPGTGTPVYKLELDYDMIAEAEGEYGEHECTDDEEITAEMDVDGDGYVTVIAASVSDNDVVSSFATYKINVEEITLNAPTLSLVGFDGVNRSYKIGWTRNTVSDEPFKISYEGIGEDDGIFGELDENQGIGEILTIKEHITVKVSVDGYNDGIAEVDAEAQGIELKRNNTESDHDWDFVNIGEEMTNMFTGAIPGSYKKLVSPEEKFTDEVTGEEVVIKEAEYDEISVEEYAKREAASEDVSDYEPVPASFGWGYPIANNRTTLNVIEGGNDQNANGFGYEEEKTGIFEGLLISCPPNANNVSCIFKYIDKADGNETGFLGVYFMARPTITFPRYFAKAGEYVEIYYGQGGSNYTNTTTHGVYQVPEDELLSVTLPNGGVHVMYIDVYTYDNLPEDIYEVGVNDIQSNGKPAVVGYYSISGAQLSAPVKGINIVKYANGSSSKVLVK